MVPMELLEMVGTSGLVGPGVAFGVSEVRECLLGILVKRQTAGNADCPVAKLATSKDRSRVPSCLAGQL